MLALLGCAFWAARAKLPGMRTLKLLGRDRTFAILRGLRDAPGASMQGWVNFGTLHGESGCSARVMMDTVRAIVAKGWAEWAGKRGGWRITGEGVQVLLLAEQLEARDGEPGAARPDGLGGEFPDRRIVDTSEFAKNEEGEW